MHIGNFVSSVNSKISRRKNYNTGNASLIVRSCILLKDFQKMKVCQQKISGQKINPFVLSVRNEAILETSAGTRIARHWVEQFLDLSGVAEKPGLCRVGKSKLVPSFHRETDKRKNPTKVK